MSDLDNAVTALEQLFQQSGLTMPAGLRHVPMHMAHEAPMNTTGPEWGPRRRVAAALFRGLWYGSDRTIGAASRAAGRDTPTYVFPEERWVVRARFAEDPIRLNDGRVEQQGAVYHVDVVDLATTRWPSCRCCAGGGEGVSA
ncbi:Hypp6602 [Branchiostoma lanceolatum]|uniref:Hypp6602 protein n=1 Tax=Branchiostoma lanceolatum TaxID=7740 RepID=A0A8J9YV88_BRALA|nr:Hypp6602 [Branchiostoma lanceolatum]